MNNSPLPFINNIQPAKNKSRGEVSGLNFAEDVFGVFKELEVLKFFKILVQAIALDKRLICFEKKQPAFIPVYCGNHNNLKGGV